MSRMLEIATKAGAGAFVVQNFKGREELGRLYEYRVELLSERSDITAKEMLGTNATVALELDDGASLRYFNGYVTAFEIQGAVQTPAFKSSTGYLYTATIHPGLWFRSRNSNSRIFSKMSLSDIVMQQLNQDQLMTIDNKAGATEVRDFVVQYRETDFAFISRLAEHAGLYYFFQHDDGKHTLVLVDASDKHQPIPGLANLSFAGSGREDTTLASLTMDNRVQPGAYAGGDYNYVTPNTHIAAVDSKPSGHDNDGFELYDHPVDTTTSSWATTYAKIRNEETLWQHAVAHGSGTERNIRVGGKTTLTDHVVASLNQEYLVIGHSFVATNNLALTGADISSSFHCEFEAIPTAVQYRSRREAPRPFVPGTQTALVVADFHSDTDASGGADPIGANMGRVKVQFFWDRYAQQSCWARVAQPWAGKGYGFQNMPRVGEEVLVQFIEGDPDRPVVVGRVYNAENMPPFKLPANASITGLKSLSMSPDGKSVAGRWNELRFDDRYDAEQIYIQAQKDYDRRVLNDAKIWVGNESHTYVAKDSFEKFDADFHHLTHGDNNSKVGGSLSHDVAKDILQVAQGRIAHQATKEIALDGGRQIVLTATDAISLAVGANFVRIDTHGVHIVGLPSVNVNSGGSAATAAPAAPVTAKEAKLAMTSEGGSKAADPTEPPKPVVFSPQASSFQIAYKTAAPLVAVCTDCAPAASPAPAPAPATSAP